MENTTFNSDLLILIFSQTYLLAKKMIVAGACCIQLENQVSDAKQCGYQDGKVTVPHEGMVSKIRAVLHAFPKVRSF